jgi:hypothetical protein
MKKNIHPALGFAKQVEGWSPGIFSKVDKWRETDPHAPWRFMTFRECRAWISDWLKHNPAPKDGFLCPELMNRIPPHIVYMALAAWRTGKTLLHCDESLFRVLGETSQTDALSGELLRRLPFWGFWLDFPADTVFAEGQGALMGAFFTLADHDNGTDALLALTLSQEPIPGRNIPLGMEYLALTDPVSTAINQQEEGVRGFWRAVLPVLFWLCSENSEWGKQGKPVRPAPRHVGKHLRFLPPNKPVQVYAGVRAGSALRQAPRASEASISGDSPSTPHRRLRPHVRKAHWQSYWKGKPTQGEEKSMLLKWKPPQIVNGQDDDSLEAVVRFMKETNKQEKE